MEGSWKTRGWLEINTHDGQKEGREMTDQAQTAKVYKAMGITLLDMPMCSMPWPDPPCLCVVGRFWGCTGCKAQGWKYRIITKEYPAGTALTDALKAKLREMGIRHGIIYEDSQRGHTAFIGKAEGCLVRSMATEGKALLAACDKCFCGGEK